MSNYAQMWSDPGLDLKSRDALPLIHTGGSDHYSVVLKDGDICAFGKTEAISTIQTKGGCYGVHHTADYGVLRVTAFSILSDQSSETVPKIITVKWA